ncbi:transposase [Acinetobacter baumannii]
MSKKHKTYTTEFKAEAIKLIEANQGNVSETARLMCAEKTGGFNLVN